MRRFIDVDFGFIYMKINYINTIFIFINVILIDIDMSTNFDINHMNMDSD